MRCGAQASASSRALVQITEFALLVVASVRPRIRVREIAPDAVLIIMRLLEHSGPIFSASGAQEMSRYVQLVEFARTTTRKQRKLGILAPMYLPF